MEAQRAVAPVLSGSVPPLAESFPRAETGFGLTDGLRPGETIVAIAAIPGAGGTGKTQLAVGFAHAMWSARAVDLLVWVAAGSRASVVACYAQAAADLDLLTSAEAHELTADATAQRFLYWLSRTERRWALVLDGVASPADLNGLWPQGPAGQVVVTSRLRSRNSAGRPGRPDRPSRARIQQAGGARLPQLTAYRLSRPAHRSARPGRRRRRAAHRARPGRRGGHGDGEHLP